MTTETDPYAERVRAIRRRAAASRAASAMHEQHPDAARVNGAKGAAARLAHVPDRRAYARWLARRRWWGAALAGPPPTGGT